MAEVPAFTPVNLLTGFLGSGKTTLLKRMLAAPALADAAVLINEFGEVGLDHHLVERIDETMVLLPSGCLCCAVRSELAEAVRDLHSRRERGLVPPFRRVIVESTGLADPFPVLSTIKADPLLRHHFVPGTVITTVDAINAGAELDDYVESNRQVAVADHLVVTKVDLAGEGGVARLTQRLRRLNPDAVLSIADERLDVAQLVADNSATRAGTALSQSGFFCEEPPGLPERSAGRHSAGISSFSITVDKPIDWTAFGVWLTMLLNRHGERVLRVKGILGIAGEARPVAIHSVQRLVHMPQHLENWPSEDRRSHVVFIVDGLDPELVKRSLHAFAVETGASS
jgi:G3E family GTPase